MCVPLSTEDDGHPPAAAGVEGSTGSDSTGTEGSTVPERGKLGRAHTPPAVRAVGTAEPSEPMVCTVSGMSHADISREQDRGIDWNGPQSVEWTGSIHWIYNPVQSRRIWIGLDHEFTNSADSGLDWIDKYAMCIHVTVGSRNQ